MAEHQGAEESAEGFLDGRGVLVLHATHLEDSSQVAVLIALVPALLMLGRSLNAEAIAAGYGPVLSLPPWLQAVLILVIGDFIGYWTHRWFHSRRLWAFHAVHHSSKELDWLSSVRLHPVNDIVSRVFQAVPFVLIGFSPVVIAAYIPFLHVLLHLHPRKRVMELRPIPSCDCQSGISSLASHEGG